MPSAGGAGGVRIGVAFDDVTLHPSPTWTYLTETDNLVAGYTIDRGRSIEFDKNDAGTATIRINDRAGALDPTNAASPYHDGLEPLRQVQIELLDPIADTWNSRFRGFIEDFDYTIDPATKLGRLTINCVDLFEICTAIEMQPAPSVGDATLATFGHNLAQQLAQGNIYFRNDRANVRCSTVLVQAGIPAQFWVIFELNVNMLPSTYSPSENVLQVLVDAADSEWPIVGNVVCDRRGRLTVHGRMSRFDPHGTWMGIAGTDAARDAIWAYRHWKCGDSFAVDADLTTTAQIRQLAFNRGLAQIKNSALCTPNQIAQNLIAGQYVRDEPSIGEFGFRSWSAENLFTDNSFQTGNSGLVECKAYAQYIVDNYAQPVDRISLLGLRTMHPTWRGAAATWKLLTQCDVGDLITVTETSVGGGGFNLEDFFIEGVHEQVEPLNPDMADVTLTLDVSPKAHFPPDYTPMTG